ncbi:hypothetical protein ACFYNZ_16330 [Streptomyces kebangsaanensis]|uniref:Uncharacterized protein n=1 Tax=Streptomyces kebangsaanensis TaxID=864058 RepID=A0ABW6KT36_9ACTN
MTNTRKKGLLARWREWWRGRRKRRNALTAATADPVAEWESPALGTVELVRPEAYAELAPSAEPLLLAAQGDVFEFHVLPHFRWHSREMSVERLRERAGALSAEARDELLKRSWALARTCDAGDPVKVEELVNSELSDGWCYEDEEGLIKCRPTVRVRIDPALRDRMLPARLEEQGMKEDLRLGLLKAAHARQLTEEWLQVIADLERSGELTPVQRQFLVPFAATLADSDFAAASDALRTARRTGAVALANVLNQATKNHEQVGLFEFANAYDKALNSFSQQMGLTPFSWILDGPNIPEGAE